MTNTALAVPTLRPEGWPRSWVEAWTTARCPGRHRYAARGPAAEWARETVETIQAVVGLHAGWLVADGRPSNRIESANVMVFADWLQDQRGHAETTISKHVDGLYRFARATQLGSDLYELRRLANLWKRRARRAPKRLANRTRIVALERLERLGRELLDEARAVPRPGVYAAIKYRDGLMILVLARRAIRRKNMMMLDQGGHLVLDEDATWLRFRASEMKGKRALQLDIHALRPELEEYLARWRPIFRHAGSNGPLWPSQYGPALGAKVASARIGRITAARLGTRVTMHAFRHALATTVAEHLPDGHIVGTTVLGHASAGVTDMYYRRHAKGIEAQAKVERVLDGMADDRDLRRALTGRL